jgi:hypothetical protein
MRFSDVVDFLGDSCYASSRALSEDNSQTGYRCISQDPKAVIVWTIELSETVPNYGSDKNNYWEGRDPAIQALDGIELPCEHQHSAVFVTELATCPGFFYLDQRMKQAFLAFQRQLPWYDALVAQVAQVRVARGVISHSGVGCYTWK